MFKCAVRHCCLFQYEEDIILYYLVDRSLIVFTIYTWLQSSYSYFFLNYLFILAGLGLHGCTWAFSSCGEQGLVLVEVHGLLIAVASLVAERGP